MQAGGPHLMSVFGEALECATPAEQRAYLDRVCGDDSQLRDRVEALLRAHGKVGGFLESGQSPAEGPGTVLGPYRLVEQLGEGGFGVVYRAEQAHPVRRQVALKVIKPGMDTRQVVARFEAERQALALMDHPGIAKVFDAGTTPTSRPFFVMELVHGVPITDHCDASRLTPRERLALFVSVCRAVQHAHQKGVIHRDLKPSNVLVTRNDGVPKVIDFGIAKALHQKLTEQTLATGAGQFVGTPLYVSPEQAAADAQGIDTRADVYSLGVVLYELLTGTTPFPGERLRGASFDEVRRILREEEPPRPSARITTLGASATTVTADRRTDPKQLGRLLRGDLDWVIMKCLEKDRNRRYESADALARDVERHLAGEPVEARPPSAGYRLGKFVRKHRRGLLTAAAFLALLLTGAVLAGWQVVREARAERDRAVHQAKRDAAVRAALDQASALRDQARAERDPRKLAAAREQAQRALALIESGPTEAELVVRVRHVAEQLDEEEKDRRFVADLDAARLGQAKTVVGESRFALERAIPLIREAFRVYGLPVGQGTPLVAASRLRQRPAEVRYAATAALDDWLDMLVQTRSQANEPHFDWMQALVATDLDDGEMREIRKANQEQDPGKRRAALERLAAAADVGRLPPQTLMRLAWRLKGAGAPGRAVELLEQVWRQYPSDFWVNHELGRTLLDTEPARLGDAVRYLTCAVALRPDSPGVRVNLGTALQAKEQMDEAIACYREAMALDPNYADAHFNLGTALQTKGQVDEAIACYRKALELDPKNVAAHHYQGNGLLTKGQVDDAIACYRKALDLTRESAQVHRALGYALQVGGKVDEAIACYRKALEIDPKFAAAHFNLGHALERKGKVDEALVCYRRAVEHDPKDAKAHTNLGAALQVKGKVDEAIACYRRAIALDANLVQPHNNLGYVLRDRGKMDEAIVCLGKACELDPKDVMTRYNLGNLLARQGRAAEAIACYRQAVALVPSYAEAHCNLGHALRDCGEFRAALAALRTGHEHGSKRKDWRYPSADWVKRCERFVQLDELLAAIGEGKARPAGAAECIELADLCLVLKRPVLAVRFFTEAFAADPELAANLRDRHRSRAAGAAALAGCGPGEEAEQMRLRRQALEWLRADLNGLAGMLEKGGPNDRKLVQMILRSWQNDVALVGVRGDALGKLTVVERARWRRLWADAAELLDRAAEAK